MMKFSTTKKWYIIAVLSVAFAIIAAINSVRFLENAVHSFLNYKTDQTVKKCSQYIPDGFLIAPTENYTDFTYTSQDRGEYIFPFVIVKTKLNCEALWNENEYSQIQIDSRAAFYNPTGITKDDYDRPIFFCGHLNEKKWVYSENDSERLKKYLRFIERLFEASDCYESVIK